MKALLSDWQSDPTGSCSEAHVLHSNCPGLCSGAMCMTAHMACTWEGCSTVTVNLVGELQLTWSLLTHYSIVVQPMHWAKLPARYRAQCTHNVDAFAPTCYTKYPPGPRNEQQRGKMTTHTCAWSTLCSGWHQYHTLLSNTRNSTSPGPAASFQVALADQQAQALHHTISALQARTALLLPHPKPSRHRIIRALQPKLFLC